jgi:hypothetical protein
MVRTQDTGERLTLLKEVVTLGEEIETAFESKIQRDFKGCEPYDIPDEDLDAYFVYQFLHNTLEHARSTITLAENGFSKQVWLVARTILEGWFYFKSFINKKPATKVDSIPKRWRSFHICQCYQSIRKFEGPAAAIQMLNDLENRIGTDVVRQAEKQFQDCQNEKLTWYRRGKIKELIKLDGDPSLEPFYESVYSLFSQVQHWNPMVVIATEIDTDAALGVVIHNILMMLLHVNDFYDLEFGDKLKDTYQRFTPLLVHEVFPFRI